MADLHHNPQTRPQQRTCHRRRRSAPTLLPTAIECAWNTQCCLAFGCISAQPRSAESSWARSLLTNIARDRVVDEWRTPGPARVSRRHRCACCEPHLGCELTPEEIIADFRTFYFETALSGFETNLWPSKTSCRRNGFCSAPTSPRSVHRWPAGTRPTSTTTSRTGPTCSRRSCTATRTPCCLDCPRTPAADPPHSSQSGNRRPSHNTCCGRQRSALRVSTRLLLAGTNRCQLVGNMDGCQRGRHRFAERRFCSSDRRHAACASRQGTLRYGRL